MANNPPYVVSPGSIKTCLERIKAAPAPERISSDFVTTKLDIKGGTGRALVPFLKKIGFVNPDGTPTDLYKAFRNPSESGAAVAAAIKIGYSGLYSYNEYLQDLSPDKFKGVVMQATGLPPDSTVVDFVARSFNKLKESANFDKASSKPDNLNPKVPAVVDVPAQTSFNNDLPINSGRLGMNLSYTINLNLPATSDVAVFNAIFRSLKENLLSGDE